MSAVDQGAPRGAHALPATALRGQVVTPREVIPDGVVMVEGEWITWVGPTRAAPSAPPPTQTTLIPGLVDIHCHGGGGVGFPEAADLAAARHAIEEHLAHGTTGLVASLVTARPKNLLRQCELLGELAETEELLGIHLEGPFLSPDHCGAQDPQLMLPGDVRLVRDADAAAQGHLVTMTVAPELPGMLGGDGVLRALAVAGAIPSIGHTGAPLRVVNEAVRTACSYLGLERAPSHRPTVTHLYNGMPPLHHRSPGPVGALLAAAARGDAVVELIGDGAHLDPGTVKATFDIAAHGAVMLVTDAIAAAGMPDGEYELGTRHVTVADGTARLASGALAGSTAHLLDMVRNTVAAGVPLVDAVRAGATTPAAVLGRDEFGALEPGRYADLVVVDERLMPLQVMRRGRWLHPTPTAARDVDSAS